MCSGLGRATRPQSAGAWPRPRRRRRAFCWSAAHHCHGKRSLRLRAACCVVAAQPYGNVVRAGAGRSGLCGAAADRHSVHGHGARWHASPSGSRIPSAEARATEAAGHGLPEEEAQAPSVPDTASDELDRATVLPPAAMQRVHRALDAPPPVERLEQQDTMAQPSPPPSPPLRAQAAPSTAQEQQMMRHVVMSVRIHLHESRPHSSTLEPACRHISQLLNLLHARLLCKSGIILKSCIMTMLFSYMHKRYPE